MAAKGPTPVFTQNFLRNLDAIEAFLEPDGKAAFQRFLDRLFEDIVPLLSRYPRSGRDFLGHRIGSIEAQGLVRRLKKLLRSEDELREFVIDDYVVLYLLRRRRLIFLAIKHHRQLSFDLRRFWAN